MSGSCRASADPAEGSAGASATAVPRARRRRTRTGGSAGPGSPAHRRPRRPAPRAGWLPRPGGSAGHASSRWSLSSIGSGRSRMPARPAPPRTGSRCRRTRLRARPPVRRQLVGGRRAEVEAGIAGGDHHGGDVGQHEHVLSGPAPGQHRRPVDPGEEPVRQLLRRSAGEWARVISARNAGIQQRPALDDAPVQPQLPDPAEVGGAAAAGGRSRTGCRPGRPARSAPRCPAVRTAPGRRSRPPARRSARRRPRRAGGSPPLS